jgi:hypothetical protein
MGFTGLVKLDLQAVKLIFAGKTVEGHPGD